MRPAKARRGPGHARTTRRDALDAARNCDAVAYERLQRALPSGRPPVEREAELIGGSDAARGELTAMIRNATRPAGAGAGRPVAPGRPGRRSARGPASLRSRSRPQTRACRACARRSCRRSSRPIARERRRDPRGRVSAAARRDAGARARSGETPRCRAATGVCTAAAPCRRAGSAASCLDAGSSRVPAR